MFLIEDEFHAEWQDGRYATLQDAQAELQCRAKIPWDDEPNRAPCVNGRTCGRKYVVIEYDDAASPWKEPSRTAFLEISASGVVWMRRE